MVKKTVVVVLIIFFICTGCKRTIVERENSVVVYKNFLYTETMPFDVSHLFNEIGLNVINNESLLSEKSKKKRLTGEYARYFLRKHKLCTEEYYKNLMGSDNSGYLVDTIKTSYDIFAYGKINQPKNIVSYFVLFQSTNTFPQKDIYSELVAFTVQNNNLQSILVLYKGSKDPDFYQKTCYQNGLFTTLENYNGPSDMTYNVDWINIRSWNELLLKTGLKSYHIHMLTYCNFYLDAIGYVRFTHLENYKVPEFVTKEIRW